jgi:hypothetical protein
MLQTGRSWVQIWMLSKCSIVPSSRTMAMGFTQPLTKMSTRKLPGGKGLSARKAWQPYRHLWANCLDNVGTLTCHSPMASTTCYGDSFAVFGYSYSGICTCFGQLWICVRLCSTSCLLSEQIVRFDNFQRLSSAVQSIVDGTRQHSVFF